MNPPLSNYYHRRCGRSIFCSIDRIFLTLVNSFKQFDLNLAITNGAPSRILAGKPVQATEFLALNIYNTAISKNQYALGQTKAVVFFIILAIVSLTQVSISKKKEVEM